MTNFYHVHNEFNLYCLDEADVQPDPYQLFDLWLAEAVSSGEPEPTAMTLTTVSSNGQPSARIVLLKSVGDDGFTFFTNYHSRKAREIAGNDSVSLVFFWPLTQRQVRIEGKAVMTEASESDAYFLSRPEGSRISAVASPQSEMIASRRDLEQRYFDAAGDPATLTRRPQFWGGYRVIPSAVEFWQGRENRLHDRILFTLSVEGSWQISRLAP